MTWYFHQHVINHNIIVCLFFVCLFFFQLENFSLIWRRHHYRGRVANFDLYSALMAIGQCGFFSLPHLLWHAASVFNGHLRPRTRDTHTYCWALNSGAVTNYSGRNHTVNNFVKTLYVLQKDKQIQKSLSISTLIHIKKCFTYTLSNTWT